MQMHMLMRVRVGEGQAGGGEGGELCADLGGELATDARARSVVDAEAELARRELPLCVDEAGDLGRRQHGSAFDHDEMEPDAQVGHGARAAYSIGSRGARHHQTGGVQDARTVRAFDRLVDGLGKAEIVGGEEDVPHISPGCGRGD